MHCIGATSYNHTRMNLRWLIFDYVDPTLELSRDERRAVRRDALRLSRPSTLGICILLLVVLPLVAIYTWAVVHYAGRFVYAVWPQGAILLRVLVVYLAVWIVIAAFGRWLYRPHVFRALCAHGHRVCLGCGYPMRGLGADSERCPECGTTRV